MVHCVVDGECSAPGELHRELEVMLAIPPSGFRGDYRDRTESLIERGKRDDDSRPEAQLATQPEVLVIDGARDEQLVRNIRVELGFAGPNHLRNAGSGIGVGWVTPAQLMRPPDFVRVHMRYSELFRLTVLVYDADSAPVGKVRDDQLCDFRKRLFIVK